MTEQEKRFFKKLGITPGPWTQGDKSYSLSESSCEIRTAYPVKNYKKTRRCLFTANTNFIDYFNNTKFASKAPEMFLSLFKYSYKSCGECCNNYGNNQYCVICPVKDLIFTLEQVSVKTFQQLLDLWESCK